MPRLRIDAMPLLAEGGVSNYVKPLVAHIIRQAGPNWQLELWFRLGVYRSRWDTFRAYRRNNHSATAAYKTLWLPDCLAKAVMQNKIAAQMYMPMERTDVFLATTEMVPVGSRARVGWIFYDLTPLRLPQFFAGRPEALLSRLKKISRRTDFIIAISRKTKADLCDLLEYPADKICVIYPGSKAAKSFHRTEPPFNLKRPYICYMGSQSLNKNVDGMLRIFARCVHEHKIDYDMVLTGKDFCGKNFWYQLLKDLKVEDRVHLKGWVTEEERDAILSNATMLWHFSWYEGFGLPLLEAAARGIPVLHSNRGALTEILSNPEQQIDPANIQEAAARAALALNSEDIRQNWKAVGYERAKRFSWDDSARMLVEWLETHAQ